MKIYFLAVVLVYRVASQGMPNTKIIDGTEVVPYSLPFMVSIQRRFNNNYTHTCSGSILDTTTILTSASCVKGIVPSNFLVVAAEHSLGTVSGEEEIRGLATIVANTAYDPDTNLHDIAILKLATPLVYTLKVQPALLPPPLDELDPPSGLEVTIAGWGDTVEVNGNGSDVLIGGRVSVIDDSTCNIIYGGDETTTIVYPSMMCSASSGTGDACAGDNGGPLFTGTGGESVIHGIISWGLACGDTQFPKVYTQVSYYLDWISANRG